MNISVIVPVYNEGAIVEENVRAIVDFFSARRFTWEFIIVDDGSGDGTRRLLGACKEKYPQLNVVSMPHKGKGAAVREGFSKSQGDWMLFFDIDLSTPLVMFDSFWAKRGERKILIGSRALGDSHVKTHQWWPKEWAGKCGNTLTRALLPLPFKDTQCGFKMYPGSFRKLLPLSITNGAAFDIEWLLIARENGYDIEEIPVTWTNREESRFKFSDYCRALADLVKIMRKAKRGEYLNKSQTPISNDQLNPKPQ